MKSLPALFLGISLIISTVIISKAIDRFGGNLFDAARVLSSSDGTIQKLEVTVKGEAGINVKN